ncbi:MAG TPA: AAA family ATPase [Syntrophorhabdaceae bacterium]|nr:AAA family ATPase [Syntrophorhabdaceae bacterium]
MRLKRLELFGFKSFLNRTVFQFNEGITSIVGPNGCGKSNIVDAIIWALGERGTKSLRVKDMGDVIFHGSNGKRPVNIAEVTIELSEADKDIAVKRRIYRDGTNEYFINNTPVRLKDVQDFFLGTGIGPNSYAIIEQGKIEYFTHMKPQERRLLIEETSGITRFEEKKREAIIRMEEVKANLERIEDIYGEVKKSFEKSQAEWERWKAYKELADRLAEVDKQILIDGYAKITKKITKAQERLDVLDGEISKKEEEKEVLKKELEAKENEFALTDSILRQLEVDIKGKEKDMENRLVEIEYLNEEKKRLQRMLMEFSGRIDTLRKRQVDLDSEIKDLNKKKEEENLLIQADEEEEKKTKESVDILKKEIEEYEAEIERQRVKLFVSMSSITDIKNQLSEIDRREKDRQKREEKRKEEKERIEARLAYLKGQYDKIKKMQEAQTAGRDEITVKEKVLFGEIEDLKKTIDLLRQKIDALNSEKKGKEIFLRQMTNLTSSVKEKPSPLRRLIDLISIDEWTEKAVERFFFREMEYTVITEEDIDEIVSTIGKNDDNYIFFHDKSLFSYSGDEKEGKVGIHIRWIDSVEDTLKRIKDGEEGIFINNEMLIDSRGLILKEKDSSKIDLQQYRERKKAEKEIKDIQANLERHMESLNEYKRQFEIKDKAHRQLRTELKAKEDAIKRYDLDAAALAAEIKTISERCEELESLKDLYEEETSTRQIEGLMEDKRRLTQEKDLIEKELESLRNRLDAVKRTYEETLSKWRSISVNLERKKNLIKGIGEDMARKTDQIEHIKVELEELGDKSEQTDKKVKECLLKIERLERDYEDIKTTTGRYIERYEGLKETSGNLHMERQSIAEKVEMTLKDMEKIKSRRESLEKEIAVFDEKRKTIQERLATSYGLQVLEGITVLPIAELEAEREKIEEEIKALGEVNFRAEKEYVETKERMEFLATQKNDLKDSMDSLKKTIIKIDTISKEIFLETFDTVNNAFKRFTNMLFKGGNGHLLFNQESAGIDMFVQLPGKKVLRMEQLSGGEKALISTAFLLSLMDTNPSPFTLLDEIDAPLDDANIISLLHIIKTITDKTQIIFITHNRITMEASNTIYGITMEEPGISKIVSVRL